VLWIGYDATRRQAHVARRELARLSRAFPIIARWQKLPGVGPIRAMVFFAHVDTPWRFPRKSKLWKYSGVGLMRRSSGTGPDGRPRPGVLRLAFAVNRHLKNALMGAATSAIEQGKNPFAAHYERMLQEGKSPSNARHTVARKIGAVMWGMWKSDRPYDPRLVSNR
jgi:transposase